MNKQVKQDDWAAVLAVMESNMDKAAVATATKAPAILTEIRKSIPTEDDPRKAVTRAAKLELVVGENLNTALARLFHCGHNRAEAVACIVKAGWSEDSAKNRVNAYFLSRGDRKRSTRGDSGKAKSAPEKTVNKLLALAMELSGGDADKARKALMAAGHKARKATKPAKA